MFKLLLNWLRSFVSADKLGILVRALLLKAGIAAANDIFNLENQKKAYEFVKELSKRDDLTGFQKAAEFNKQMLEWAKKVGRDMSSSMINCLREMAVMAVKSETSEKTSSSEQS